VPRKAEIAHPSAAEWEQERPMAYRMLGGEIAPGEGTVREGMGGRLVEGGLNWGGGEVLLALVLTMRLAVSGTGGDAAAPADPSLLSSISSSSPSPAQRQEKAEIPR